MSHTYLGNYPSNSGSDWTDALQGVAHDSEHWYFTQEERIFKFHVTSRLPGNRAHAVSMIGGMPNDLSRRGANHFGDPDHRVVAGRGYLFVPVEGNGGAWTGTRLAVFATDSAITYVGSASLSSQTKALDMDRAGWCAIHPTTKLLYTSYKFVDVTHPVFRYSIDFAALARGKVRLSAEPPLQLVDSRRNPLAIAEYIQGGTFAPNGNLYIVNGKMGLSGSSAPTGGIRVFNGRGRLINQSVQRSSSRSRFRFEFKPGFPHFQEPEGITWWDLDRLSPRFKLPSGKMAGQLHAILLNKRVKRVLNDKIWFKHYRIL